MAAGQPMLIQDYRDHIEQVPLPMDMRGTGGTGGTAGTGGVGAFGGPRMQGVGGFAGEYEGSSGDGGCACDASNGTSPTEFALLTIGLLFGYVRRKQHR